MTYVMTDAHRYTETISDADEAATVFDDNVFSIMPFGGAGRSLWFAPSGGEDQLRVDIDFEADRAKVTWLPDNAYGVELAPGEPITVMWYIDADVITIPGEQARVSTATAQRAVVEYVETGQRPTCVSWEPEPQPAA
jgi:Immunity protein Imm1